MKARITVRNKANKHQDETRSKAVSKVANRVVSKVANRVVSRRIRATWKTMTSSAEVPPDKDQDRAWDAVVRIAN